MSVTHSNSALEIRYLKKILRVEDDDKDEDNKNS